MARIGVVLHDDRIVLTDTDSWELIDSGGEADVYLVRLHGQQYIAKVFTDKQTMLSKPIERIAEILRRLTRLRHRCGGRLPESLTLRGLPVGFASIGERAVLLFRFIEGFETIADLLVDEDKLRNYILGVDERERRRLALDVLRSLACLEYADVVHVDVTTANAALGSYEGRYGAYLFDLETAALMNSSDYPLVVIPARDVNYMPVEVLEELGIDIRSPEAGELPLVLAPTRLDRELLAWVTWTPSWYGLQLVGFIYAGISLFQGLPTASAKYWKRILARERESGYPGGWPPRALAEEGYVGRSEYEELRRLWSGLGDVFVNLVYRLYVVDVAERHHLPSYTISTFIY